MLGISLLTFSCSKETVSEDIKNPEIEMSIEEQIIGYSNTPFEGTDEVAAYADAMREILIMAKDPKFRKIVFEQASLQRSGDYDLSLERLEEALQGKEKFKRRTGNLKMISDRILRRTESKPIIFFPKAETLERKSKTTKIATSSEDLNEPIAVFKNVYDENYDSPGYVLDENNNLVYSGMVSEEYAWENDVYVIGEAENFVVAPEEPWAGGGGGSGGGSTPEYRTEGRAEYGAIIQVTNLNEIEHWTDGKLEFRVVVTSAAGLVVKDESFPKRARDNFQDRKWTNSRKFYFNWNTSNIGNFTIEKWIERDGGNSAAISISIPPAEEGGPTTTITVPSENQDDDLGQSIVQFSDRIGQIYGISYMNFKRD